MSSEGLGALLEVTELVNSRIRTQVDAVPIPVLSLPLPEGSPLVPNKAINLCNILSPGTADT